MRKRGNRKIEMKVKMKRLKERGGRGDRGRTRRGWIKMEANGEKDEEQLQTACRNVAVRLKERRRGEVKKGRKGETEPSVKKEGF